MIINEDSSNADYQIESYESGKIIINRIAYTKSLIITPTALITDWEPQSISELALSHLQILLQFNPKIVLLGTGAQFKMPPTEISDFFQEQSIGIECMNTAAACRTYNALTSEGRNVIAAMII
jgi:uncharacterized protein